MWTSPACLPPPYQMIGINRVGIDLKDEQTKEYLVYAFAVAQVSPSHQRNPESELLGSDGLRMERQRGDGGERGLHHSHGTWPQPSVSVGEPPLFPGTESPLVSASHAPVHSSTAILPPAVSKEGKFGW